MALAQAGDVDIAHGYNGQLAEVVAKEPEKLAYVVPKEGATLWMDNVCIPGKARNVANAYRFLDYIMDGKVNAEIVNGVSYASANVPAKQYGDFRRDLNAIATTSIDFENRTYKERVALRSANQTK